VGPTRAIATPRTSTPTGTASLEEAVALARASHRPGATIEVVA
jgi:hypothetical protein